MSSTSASKDSPENSKATPYAADPSRASTSVVSLNLVPTNVSIESQHNNTNSSKQDRKTSGKHSGGGGGSAHWEMIDQIHGWIVREREKAALRKAKKELRKSEKKKALVIKQQQQQQQQKKNHENHEKEEKVQSGEVLVTPPSPATSTSSATSTEDISHLAELESILLSNPGPTPTHKRSQRKLRHHPSKHQLEAQASSLITLPPSCEEVLPIPEKVGKEAFKLEVLKLTHTLKCKRWRHVPLEASSGLVLKKISGAMTNSVYEVVPPDEYRFAPPATESSTTGGSVRSPRPIPKLLLRIYGPHVSHLIDRPTELSILTRLAKRNIGPKLLGTFSNGRFEEFLDSSITLTRLAIRDPPTSRNIAKRLRELHQGMVLLPSERDAGPAVLRNWKKWAPRAAARVALRDAKNPTSPVLHKPWPVFAQAVEAYFNHVIALSGGPAALAADLVFAHNDTQYGNILRVSSSPSSSTPPTTNNTTPTTTTTTTEDNTHKSLTIIDFEYAAANPRGFDLANHFCEWMADYHCATPHRMREDQFPSVDERERFVRAYVLHGAVLDGRGGVGEGGKEKEGGDGGDEEVEREVERVMNEVERWTAASSVMWAAWGIVQAKEEAEAEGVAGEAAGEGGEGKEGAKEGEEEAEFDYWGYASERARHFWSEFERLGLRV